MAWEASGVAETRGVAEEGQRFWPKRAEVPSEVRLKEEVLEIADRRKLRAKSEEVPNGVRDWESFSPKATLEEKVGLDITGELKRRGAGETGTYECGRLPPNLLKTGCSRTYREGLEGRGAQETRAVSPTEARKLGGEPSGVGLGDATTPGEPERNMMGSLGKAKWRGELLSNATMMHDREVAREK